METHPYSSRPLGHTARSSWPTSHRPCRRADDLTLPIRVSLCLPLYFAEPASRGVPLSCPSTACSSCLWRLKRWTSPGANWADAPPQERRRQVDHSYFAGLVMGKRGVSSSCDRVGLVRWASEPEGESRVSLIADLWGMSRHTLGRLGPRPCRQARTAITWRQHKSAPRCLADVARIRPDSRFWTESMHKEPAAHLGRIACPPPATPSAERLRPATT